MLHQGRSRLDIRKYFFSEWVVGQWHSCLGVVVESLSVGVLWNRGDVALCQQAGGGGRDGVGFGDLKSLFQH